MSSPSLRACWMLLRSHVLLWRWRGPRLARLLRAPSTGASAAQLGHAQLLAADIARAARLVPGTRCLARAIALVRLLHLAALPARLMLGVRRDAGAVRAHAWVEMDGRALAEDPAALCGFEPLADAPQQVDWER